jgi:hypothetical protein
MGSWHVYPRGAKDALGIFVRSSVGSGRAYPLMMSLLMMESRASILISALYSCENINPENDDPLIKGLEGKEHLLIKSSQIIISSEGDQSRVLEVFQVS